MEMSDFVKATQSLEYLIIYIYSYSIVLIFEREFSYKILILDVEYVIKYI